MNRLTILVCLILAACGGGGDSGVAQQPQEKCAVPVLAKPGGGEGTCPKETQ